MSYYYYYYAYQIFKQLRRGVRVEKKNYTHIYILYLINNSNNNIIYGHITMYVLRTVYIIIILYVHIYGERNVGTTGRRR